MEKMREEECRLPPHLNPGEDAPDQAGNDACDRVGVIQRGGCAHGVGLTRTLMNGQYKKVVSKAVERK